MEIDGSNILKSFLFCIALVSFAPAALAQDAKQEPMYPKRVFSNDGKFVTEYEADENTTIVFLEPVIVESSNSAKTSLRLAASFQYEGRSPVKPKHIALALFALNPECKFSAISEMTVVMNGEPVEFGFSLKSFRERKPDELSQ
jgi:hypothetical protein